MRGHFAERDAYMEAGGRPLQIIALVLDPALHDVSKGRSWNRVGAAQLRALPDRLFADRTCPVQMGKLHLDLGQNGLCLEKRV